MLSRGSALSYNIFIICIKLTNVFAQVLRKLLWMYPVNPNKYPCSYKHPLPVFFFFSFFFLKIIYFNLDEFLFAYLDEVSLAWCLLLKERIFS